MDDQEKRMGEIFRELRIGKDFTQRGLALKMGVSHSTISKIENNERRPKYEILVKFSEALDVDLDYLISISKEDTTVRKKSLRYPQEGKDLIAMYNLKKEARKLENLTKVPVLGSIRAGEAILAEQNIEGYITLDPNSLCPDKKYYALKVKGDSMDKLFPEGTTLVVEKTSMVENSQIAVVGINGYDATVKKVSFADENIALIPQSNNPAYETKVYDIYKDEIHIMGRVVQAITYF